MRGTIGPEAVFEHVESFLDAMSRRGFKPNDAYKIFSSVNTLIFGAVVRTSYFSSLRSKGVGHGEALGRSLYERNPEELPHVRACSEFAEEERAYDFYKELERVMASFVAEFADDEK